MTKKAKEALHNVVRFNQNDPHTNVGEVQIEKTLIISGIKLFCIGNITYEDKIKYNIHRHISGEVVYLHVEDKIKSVDALYCGWTKNLKNRKGGWTSEANYKGKEITKIKKADLVKAHIKPGKTYDIYAAHIPKIKTAETGDLKVSVIKGVETELINLLSPPINISII